MRIFEKVASGAPLVDPTHEPIDAKAVSAMRKLANTSIRIVSDEAAQYFYHSPREDWSYESGAFGRAVPPFDNMWLEVITPTQAYIDKQWVSIHRTRMAFVFVKESDCIWQVYFLASKPKHGPVIGYQAISRVVFSPDGGVERDLMYDDHVISKDLAIGLLENLSIAFLALGWMNCRNVELVDQNPSSVQLRKRQKKGTFLGLEYKKIILDGRSRRSLTSNQQAEKRHQRLHVVRGHFKTYTEEKPLMGKFVGQYWWHQQTRGDAGLGLIHHQYEVKQRTVK